MFRANLAALAITTALTACTPPPAYAADITCDRATNGARDTITITGLVVPGDQYKFYEAASHEPRGSIVILNSPGGDVNAGLAIGRDIHRHRFHTYVPDNATCASICGAIWLGGIIHYLAPNGHVGFHSAWQAAIGSGAVYPSDEGNALVGAYYAELGLHAEDITTLTAAPPADMYWLTPQAIGSLAIDITVTNSMPGQPMRWGPYEAKVRAAVPDYFQGNG